MNNFNKFLKTNINEVLEDEINEAVNLRKKLPSGGTVVDLLQSIYDAHEDKLWTTKEIKHLTTAAGLDTKATGNLFFALKKSGGPLTSPTKGMYQLTGQVIVDYKLDKNNNKSSKSGDVPQEDADGTAKGRIKSVKKIATNKVKKFVVPQVGTNSKYMDQLKTILSHMSSTADGVTRTTFMLAGDPGCIVGDTELEIEISEELYEEFMKFMEGRD